jgi:hypothetical protein
MQHIFLIVKFLFYNNIIFKIINSLISEYTIYVHGPKSK